MGPRVRYTPPFWQRSLLHHLSAGRSALLLCGSVPCSHGRSYARRCLEIVLPLHPFPVCQLQLTMPPLSSLFRSYLPQSYHIVQEVQKGKEGKEKQTPRNHGPLRMCSALAALSSLSPSRTPQILVIPFHKVKALLRPWQAEHMAKNNSNAIRCNKSLSKKKKSRHRIFCCVGHSCAETAR